MTNVDQMYAAPSCMPGGMGGMPFMMMPNRTASTISGGMPVMMMAGSGSVPILGVPGGYNLPQQTAFYPGQMQVQKVFFFSSCSLLLFYLC